MITAIKRILKIQVKKIYCLSIGNKKHANLPVDSQEKNSDIKFCIDFISRGSVDNGLKVEGWLYSTAPVFDLFVQVNGQSVLSFQPDVVRQDVQCIFPEMEQSITTGFNLHIDFPAAHLSTRGATQVQLYYRSADSQELLTTTFVYHSDHYQKRICSGDQAFYFTVASSNISLGGFGDFKQKLAPFAIGNCQLGFMAPLLYMRSTKGAQHDWQFDPSFDESRTQASGKLVLADSLDTIFKYAIEHQVPCVIGLNGGIWGDAAGSCAEWDLTDHLEESEENCQWNQRNQVMPDDYLTHLTGAETAPELSRALTLNHYNSSVRQYKKRNLQQVAQSIVEFSQQHPQLYLGSNLDPDCYHNPFFEGEQWYDFNPQTLEQFRHWLSATGAYANELKHCIQHTPWSLPQLNCYLGTDFESWSDVEPPRHVHCKPCTGLEEKALTLWEQFRRHTVHRHYVDLSDWLVEAGLHPRMIFSSQGFTSPRGRIDPFALQLNSPLKNYDSGGMSLAGSKPDLGHVGAILYGESARNAINTENQLSFFENIRALDPDWAVVEFNPADLRDDAQALPDYGYSWNCLREMFNHGARFVNLMAWNGSSGTDHGQTGFNAHMALRDTPLEQALIDFMLMYADIARGDQCYTFGTQRHASLDGWRSKRGQLTATLQGLQVALSDGCAELCAPQPYLYSGTESISIEFVGSMADSLSISLEVNGLDVECDRQPRQQGMSGCSVYRLILVQALPSQIEELKLSITASSKLRELLVNRVVFFR